MFKTCFRLLLAVAAISITSLVFAQDASLARPSLSHWVKQKLLQNPSMQAAHASLDAARSRLRAADQPLFNPELELDYENADVSTYSGGVSQTIDWSDKRAARSSMADYELLSANASLIARRQTLATALLKALMDWHSANERLSISQKQADLIRRSVKLAERRRKAGDINQADLGLTRMVSAAVAFEQSEAQENVIQARRALMSLTGQDERQLPPFSSQFPELKFHCFFKNLVWQKPFISMLMLPIEITY
ncbi:MAG: TolC family protein, partial [gamma proteobacterium symbiont of Bathyaustriella thionipta]|nr:TolC family protein [gamma proteobacterium symbiont of Bathyaustriella thionipta]